MATVRKTEVVTKESDVVVSDISGVPIVKQGDGLARNRLIVSTRNQGGFTCGSQSQIQSTGWKERCLDVTPEECRDLLEEIDEAIRRVRLKHRSRIIGGAQ